MPIVLIIVAGILFIAQRGYRRHILRRVSYAFSTGRVLFAQEEPFQLITTLANPTRLFIPYIHTREPLPEGVKLLGDYRLGSAEYGTEARLIHKAYLLPRSAVTCRVSACVEKRGQYIFSHAWLHGGDFLGLSEGMEKAPRNTEIVVYPNPADNANIKPSLDNFLGDISVRRFILHDPMLTTSYREYTGREPLKSISWLHTARLHKPMVKVFDYTAEISVSILVNIDAENEENIERCYALAHTVCKYMEEAKINYDVRCEGWK
ncbi:MAG: DUF58 domain-containing protein [Defluviitaleaceae bacterium]|nr:DUF58 domain-containing protein [Defluviitaleaceae bacterium]MCL2274982.1 DUF58 domain-containing protein [Defluviitaleaceae bacterium]